MESDNDDCNIAEDDREMTAPINVPYKIVTSSGKGIGEMKMCPAPLQNHPEAESSNLSSVIEPDSVPTSVPNLSPDKSHPSKAEFCDRAHAEYFEKDLRLREEMALAWKREMKGCTFAPVLRSTSPPRPLAKFLEDQKTFCKDRQDRVKTLSDKLQSEIQTTYQAVPKIGEYSRELAKRSEIRGNDVYSRLYERGLESCKAAAQASAASGANLAQYNIQPKPSPVVAPEFIEESVRRLTGVRHFGKRRLSGSPLSEKTKPISASIKICNTKLESDIVHALDSFKTDLFSLTQLKELISALRLDTKVPEQDNKMALVEDTWKILDSEKRGGASKSALKTFLCAVFGVSAAGRREISQNSAVDGNSPKLGLITNSDFAKPMGTYDETGNYRLTGLEAGLLYQKYGLLVKSERLSKRGSSPGSPRGEMEAECTYSPRTNKNSTHLAAEARNRVIAAVASTLPSTKSVRPGNSPGAPTPVHEILLMQNALYNKDVMDKKKARELEAAAFSFRPKINRQQRSASPKQCLNEEILGWVGREKEKRVVPSDEYYYKRDVKEYTFKPKINQQTNAKTKSKDTSKPVKGMDKSVNRILKGRLERERVAEMTQSRNGGGKLSPSRSAASSAKTSAAHSPRQLEQRVDRYVMNSKRYSPSPNSPRSPNGGQISDTSGISNFSNGSKPIICLVLNIGQTVKENVFIYPQDNPKEIIESLCKKHNLEKTEREKLENAVWSSVRTIAARNANNSPI